MGCPLYTTFLKKKQVAGSGEIGCEVVGGVDKILVCDNVLHKALKGLKIWNKENLSLSEIFPLKSGTNFLLILQLLWALLVW